MSKHILISGKSQLDGKSYALKVSPEAYPDDILKGLGFTKVTGDLQKGTTLLRRNRASGTFGRVRLNRKDASGVVRFVADPNVSDFSGLLSKSLSGAKIIGFSHIS
jgi:hypothetical protein